MNKWEYLQQQIEHHGIYRCPPGTDIPGKKPGKIYTWQFYLRRVMFDPKFIMIAAEQILDKVNLLNTQLGACEDAGVPLACALSMLTGTPMMTIKKTRKAYGLLNFTEGIITGDPVVLVDDLAGSAATLRSAQSLLKTFKIPMADQYITLVNKTQGTHDTYLDAELVSLFTCEDFAMSWKAYVTKYNKEPEFGFYC